MDTKFEDFNSKNMDDAVNIWRTSHIILYEIKAWNKVYDRMHMAKFYVNSYRPCKWSFYDKVFLHNGCTFEEKGRVRKMVITILTFVTFKIVKIIYIWYTYNVHIPLKMGDSSALWHWTYRHIPIVLTST